MSTGKVFSVKVDEARIKELKHLAADTGREYGDLLEEAIELLLKKHGREEIYFRMIHHDATQVPKRSKK